MNFKGSTPLNQFSFDPSQHWISACLAIVLGELWARGVDFEPKLWVSDDWYCLDGTIGIATPFYLVSADLTQYIFQKTGIVEGKNSSEALKILRHEMGHALDNAFDLRKCPVRQKLFGQSTLSYPTSYFAQTTSHEFVNYLGGGYAQSHPDEDFAETFAVWLTDRRWRSNYRGKALQKLRYMDQVMSGLRHQRPVKKKFLRVDAIEKDTRTLSQYINSKNTERKNHLRGNFGKVLLSTFAKNSFRADNIKASEFLKSERQEIVKKVAAQTALRNSELVALIRRMEETSFVNELVLSKSQEKTKEILVAGLAMKAKTLIDYGWHKVPM